MILNALATQPHYAAHIVPYWLALEPEERGTFHAMGAPVYAEALRLGVPPGDLRRHRQMPPSRRHGDRSLWFVAGYPDLDRLGPYRRAVYIEHGTGQTYQGNAYASHYPGGPGRDRVAVFLHPNARVAELNEAAYPHAQHLTVGCAHVERLRAYREENDAARHPVATFHFDASTEVAPEARSAWEHYRPALPDVVRKTSLAGHGHPRNLNTLAVRWEAMGASVHRTQEEALTAASVLVADNTSCLFQAAALGIPVVVLNAPWYRRDVEHGLRFWEHANVGLQVDDPADLLDAIHVTLRQDPQAERRAEVAAELYPQPFPEGPATTAARFLRGMARRDRKAR